MQKLMNLRPLAAALLVAMAPYASAATEYHVVVTKIGFPVTASGSQGGTNGSAGAGGNNAGSGGNQPAPASCTLPWGGTLASGQSTKAYSQSATTYPTTCESVAVTESCSDGTLSAPTASQACAMAPTVALAATTLPNITDTGTYTHDFNTNLTIGDTSVRGPVTWSVANGTLPAGLSLNTATGVVSGKPTSQGTANFTLQASYKGISAQQTYQLTVAASACTLPWGTTLASGQSVPAYSQSAVTYPTTCESVAVTESCSDGTLSAPTASQACAMAPTVALAATTLPNITDTGTYTHDFNTNLTIGDTSVRGPVTWSVASGTLPAGLSLNTATGVVSGKPTSQGTANFTLQASYKGISAQQTYQLTVAASACTLPWGTTLASGQSVPAYSQSAVTYPTTCESVAVTESCSDGTLSAPTASQACAMAPTVALAATTLPNITDTGTYTHDFNTNLTIGDTSVRGPVTWSVASGTLPAGLSLNTATGVVSGKPTSQGTANFTLQASYKGITAQQAYQLTVAASACTLPWGTTLASGQSVPAYSQSAVTYPTTCESVAVTESCSDGTLSAPLASQACAVVPTVTLSGTTIPTAQVNQPYSYDLSSLVTLGDSAPNTSLVSWSVISGALPSGLKLNSNGTISGTPTSGGNSTFTLSASYKNTAGQHVYTLVSLNITVALTGTTTIYVPVGQPYSFDFNSLLSVSGDPSYSASAVTWENPQNDLPPELALSSTGIISGTAYSLNNSGNSFHIGATYKNVTATQTYTVIPHDPFFKNVTTLLHFDESANSQQVTDVVGTAYTVKNLTQGSTTKKFGASSAYFSNVKTGGYYPSLSTAGSRFVLGSKDFTIEAWIYPTSAAQSGQLAGIHKAGVAADWLFYLNKGYLGFHWNTSSDLTSTTMAPAVNTWSHVAAIRAGNTLYLAVNGKIISSTTLTASVGVGAGFNMTIGTDATLADFPYAGYIDDFRITIGTGRYTTNFIPQSAAFPNQ